MVYFPFIINDSDTVHKWEVSSHTSGLFIQVTIIKQPYKPLSQQFPQRFIMVSLFSTLLLSNEPNNLFKKKKKGMLEPLLCFLNKISHIDIAYHVSISAQPMYSISQHYLQPGQVWTLLPPVAVRATASQRCSTLLTTPLPALSH